MSKNNKTHINESLSQSRDKFRELFSKSPIGTLLYDKNGQLIEVNKSALQITGIPSIEAFKRINLFDNLHIKFRKEELIKNGYIKFQASFDLEKVKHADFYHSIKKGILFLDYNVSTTDSGFLLQIQDITERKQMEEGLKAAYDCLEEQIEERTAELKGVYESLQENEERLSLAQKAANIGIFEENFQTGAIFWTPELEALHGLQPGEFPRTMDAWKKFVHPDDPLEVLQVVEHAFETGKSVEGEWRVIWPDGSVHWLAGRWQVFKDAEGNPLKMISANIDVTKRKEAEEALKESEERFDLAVKAAQEGIWDWNMETDKVWHSHRYNEMLGYSDDEMGNHVSAWLHLLHPDDKKRTLQLVDAVMIGERDYEIEFRLRHRDGHYLNILSRGFPVRRDSDGKIVRIVGTHFDLTELKKTEEKLQETVHDLERSNEELDQFAYVTSHDLQEPLRTITSFTQLLKRRYKGNLDSDADEFMDYIVDATKRMQNLIKELLEYSRVISKGEKFKLVSTKGIVKDILSDYQVTIKENNGEITCDELPEVYSDKRLLTQVFQNLIGNAIKYRKPEEPPKIHISARKEDNEYVFSISDNGIGIEPQYFNRIFMIFQRLHTIEKYEGTGIGLAIVKKIIDRLQGRIWLESELGKGSTFYFTIPINLAKT